MKKTILLLALLLSMMTVEAAVKIDRIDPTDWFVGMKDASLQLMVYGKGVRNAEVSTDYAGVWILPTTCWCISICPGPRQG